MLQPLFGHTWSLYSEFSGIKRQVSFTNKKWKKVKVAHLWLILWYPTVHGIPQARILEWVAYPFSSKSSQPRNPTQVSCTADGFFTNWAIKKAPISKNKNWMRFMTYESNPHIVKYDWRFTENKFIQDPGVYDDWNLSKCDYGFSGSHVWMWELDHKEGWAPKNWCFWLWCWRRLLRVPWTAKRSN